ncbi:hypothetical protein GGF32_005163 [Allomyces javanicus]|nr:hypothetical protein GGF32_005163 [Allomyces javanicus]
MTGPWTPLLPPWLVALTLRHPLASKLAAATALAVTAYLFLCRKRASARPLVLADGTRVYSPAFVFQHARYLTVNGKVLRVLHRRGPAGKPAVVFLHGMGGNLAQWAPLMEKVSEVAEVVGVECVGHGMSADTGRPDDYRTLSMVDDIASALTSTLPPTRDLVLVCHSYGCCMGTYLASRPHFGHRIRGMAFLGGRALMPPTAITATRKLAALPSPILTLLRLYDRWGGVNSASVNRYLGPNSPRSLRALQAVWNKHLDNAQLKTLAGGLQWVGEDEYNKVACPVLVMMGDKDGAVPVGASVEDYRRVLAGKGMAEPVVVLPGIGHQVMLEATDEVWSRMTRFLDEACAVKLV